MAVFPAATLRGSFPAHFVGHLFVKSDVHSTANRALVLVIFITGLAKQVSTIICSDIDSIHNTVETKQLARLVLVLTIFLATFLFTSLAFLIFFPVLKVYFTPLHQFEVTALPGFFLTCCIIARSSPVVYPIG